jgi:hypothetical protein
VDQQAAADQPQDAGGHQHTAGAGLPATPRRTACRQVPMLVANCPSLPLPKNPILGKVGTLLHSRQVVTFALPHPPLLSPCPPLPCLWLDAFVVDAIFHACCMQARPASAALVSAVMIWACLAGPAACCSAHSSSWRQHGSGTRWVQCLHYETAAHPLLAGLQAPVKFTMQLPNARASRPCGLHPVTVFCSINQSMLHL